MKKIFTPLISLLLAVSIPLDSSLAIGLPARTPVPCPIFNEEALSPRDIQTGTLTPVMRQAQLREETAALDEESGFNRRALLRGAASVVVGTGLAVALAVAQPTDARFPFNAPEFQDISLPMRPYLKELATQWERSTNSQERAAASYVRKMAEHPDQTIQFFPAGVTSVPTGVNFRAEPKIIYSPTYLRDMFWLMSNGTETEKRLARLNVNALIIKEVGGILHYERYPYLQESSTLAMTLVLDLMRSKGRHFQDAQVQELVKIGTAITMGVETAGYLIFGDYLANQDLPTPIDGSLPNLPHLSAMGQESIREIDLWKTSLSPSLPDRQWRISVRHILDHLANQKTNESMGSSEVVIFNAALSIEALNGHAVSDGNDSFKPKLSADGSAISREFMRYLDDPSYYLATPQQIRERLEESDIAVLNPVSAGVIAATFLAAERILLRKPFARAVPPVPTQATDIDRLFKASAERPTLSGPGWSFVRTGLRTGELTRTSKNAPRSTRQVQSDALVSLSRSVGSKEGTLNKIYSAAWAVAIYWSVRSLLPILAQNGEWKILIYISAAFVSTAIFAGLYHVILKRRNHVGLIETGIHRFTRNPMYLAQRLADVTVVAISIEHGLWQLALPFALVFLINRRLIAWEETRLTLNYGKPYQDYLARVPRWIGRGKIFALAGLLAVSAVVGRTQPAQHLDSLTHDLQQAVADRPYDASTIRREVDEVKADWKAALLTHEQVAGGLQPLLTQPFETPAGTPFSQYGQIPGLPIAAQQQALKRQLVTIFHLPSFPKSLLFDIGVDFWGPGDGSKPPVEDETPGLLQSGNFKVTYHWWAGGQPIEYVGDLRTGTLQPMPVGQLFPTPPRGMHGIAGGRVLIDSNKPFSAVALQDITVTITHSFTDRRHFDEVRGLLLNMAWALHLNAHAMKLSPSAKPQAEERFPGIASIGPLGLAITPQVTVVPKALFLALGVSRVMNVDTRVGGFFNEKQGAVITPERYSYFLSWLSGVDAGLGRRLTTSAPDRGLAGFNDLVNTAEHILFNAHYLSDREAILELTGHESTHAEIHKASTEDRAVLLAAYRAMKEDPAYSAFLTTTLGQAYDLQNDNFFDEHWTWYLWPNMGGSAQEDNKFVQTVERQIRAASLRHPEMADTWKRLPVILQDLRDRASERAYDITDKIIDKLNNLPKRAGLLFLPHGGHNLWVPVPGNRRAVLRRLALSAA